MKKILIAILVLCFFITFWMLIMLNGKINTLQAEINILRDGHDRLSGEVDRKIAESAPLTIEEVETFQHNIDILNDLYPAPRDLPVTIARQCFTLQRNGKMESSRIINVVNHTPPEERSVEIITEDGEHYWFLFYESGSIHTISKGENKETLLFAIVE